jgi:hypothetical protein
VYFFSNCQEEKMIFTPPKVFRVLVFLLLPAILLACTLPFAQPTPVPETSLPPSPPPNTIPAPVTPAIVHVSQPANEVSSAGLVYDVDSSGTAPEKRAPYGDSYNLNRLERPFSQDMTYLPDLDIVTFQVSEDDTWIYVSIQLIGLNPNNDLGINYGVEIDNDADGYGDYIVWARPPYTEDWTADNVQVFQDKNHDTAGYSPVKSDAPFDGDGYETLIFDVGVGDDPDLAWVRIKASARATVQFAFKRTLTDGSYMLGVLADTGLKDVGQLDYVDRFTLLQAGSPVRSDIDYYPLKALYAVDNTCWQAYGFVPTGYEPKLCPPIVPVEPTKETAGGCENPGQYHSQSSCEAASCAWRRDLAFLAAVQYHCTYP